MIMKPNWNETFEQAVNVLSIIEQNGYETYFVGGCVRDFLLNRPIKDIDIATAALPEELMDIFDSVIPVGIEHGTVIVRFNQVSYEVTTFRHEGIYTDQRRPDDVTFIRHIEEDLQRRDFTINALAMDRHGEIKDLFSGREDLDKQLIRSVGNAAERFMEDPLRMLRGVRFTSQLGFRIEKETYNELYRLRAEIETIAIERITDELINLFQGECVQEAIEYMKQLKLYAHIPLWKEHPDLIHKLPENLSAFYSIAEVITLFHYLDETITIPTWVREWKCSNKTKKASLQLFDAIEYFSKKGIDKWLVYTLPVENQLSFNHLTCLLFNKEVRSDIEKQYNNLAITNRAQLKINGHELQALFPELPKGRWLRNYLEKIEYEVVMDQLINTKNDIKEWILCHPPEID